MACVAAFEGSPDLMQGENRFVLHLEPGGIRPSVVSTQ